MNSYERVTAVLSHHLPDCVPAAPVLLLQGAAELGMELPDYFSRGEHLAEGQMRLWHKFGHDVLCGFPHVVEDITAFGGSLMFHRSGPPSAGGMVLRSYDDVFSLSVPDPASSPVLHETLVALNLLAQQVKGEIPILGACIAPFSLPSMLMGTEMWMELLFIESPPVREPVLNHLLTVMLDFVITWANMQLEAGADAVVLADGMASAAVLTRAQFAELALPVITEVVRSIRGPVIHEGVGDIVPMLDLLTHTGIVAAMLTPRDHLIAAKTLVDHRLALIGNLNNIEMRRWTAADMTRAARATLAQAAPGGGFMLAAQGPEIPLGVSDEAIQALVRAAHAWRY
jgi:uroporphyrinogen decarboxylase